MRRKLAAILIMAAVVLTGGIPPANAETPGQLELVGAEVLANGAAATLTFDITCTPNFYDQLQVTLTQSGTAAGDASVEPDCTGEAQTVTVLVLPRVGAEPFQRGKATVAGALGTCSAPFTCTSEPFDIATRLTKGRVGPPAQTPDTVRVVSASLTSGGTAVRVVLDVTCRSDNFGSSIGAVVSQRAGRTTTQSRVSSDLSCAGVPQTVFLTLPVESGQANFRPRRAFIRATVFNCVVILHCETTNVDTVRRLVRRVT